ncbi:glycosyltransferase family 4 protein [Streptomyces sp. NBC_00859]|uniref:glycosyltransferase family 4 protein n=1 Tax=Streptomyces sp. NBC_00859 TaxID=2903682 RepID=UPI0038699C2D|nr:glycosyltransferase family 4 protein [Streptomyces sp. NBC_00859]
MHISFMLHNAYGIGGTIRTTFTLAGTLAEQHDVEIVSVFRHLDRPTLGAPAGVRMSHLVDLRKESADFAGDDPHHSRPATVFPRGDHRHRQYSRLTDTRIAGYLKSVEADVVVGTRPGLNVQIARQTRRGPVRIGQEHLTLDSHNALLRREIGYRYGLLDAVTTVSEADAHAYRTRLAVPGLRIEAIPNSVPEPVLAASGTTAKWVVAAGRLTETKRFDLLIRAFEQVVAVRPDWRLRIYGSGDASGNEKGALRALINELGLYNHVFLMGPANPIEAEWVKGSVAVVTSRLESFGMSLVEAMRSGLPVVSTDCPHGPREIISDGTDGRLVPVGDTGAIASALLELIEDDALRAAMGRAARSSSARFDPAPVAARHEALFAGLAAGRGGGPARGALRDWLLRARGTAGSRAYGLRHRVSGAVRRRRAA